METLKKVVAAIAGILVIIALILLAKWLGDRIREKIFPSTNQTQQAVTTNTVAQPAPVRTRPTAVAPKTATISATPATGPMDGAYVLLGFIALAGLTSKWLAKRVVS